MSIIATPKRCQACPGAVARVYQVERFQLIQTVPVSFRTLTLITDFTIPIQTVSFERVLDGVRCARSFARGVYIFNPEKPFTVLPFRIQITCQRANQGAEMQWTSGGGGKPADIGGFNGLDLHGAEELGV